MYFLACLCGLLADGSQYTLMYILHVDVSFSATRLCILVIGLAFLPVMLRKIEPPARLFPATPAHGHADLCDSVRTQKSRLREETFLRVTLSESEPPLSLGSTGILQANMGENRELR